MAIHWQIPFVSLRTHTRYTVNVYDTTYSGSPISLKGAADPFVTDEDGDDDPFAPIITQSGKLRIIDDGFAADGVTPFDWKQFVPSVAVERPVTLTHMVNGTAVVDWQGFIQAQDFSGELYGNPQRRDFPLMCAVSLLKSQEPSTTDISKHNFAWLLNYTADLASSLSGGAVGFDTFIIQGNYDAQQWLHKQFEWMNFLQENNSDDEGDMTAQYDIYEILEDTFKFWGWTCRTQGRTMYLTCFDDLSEPKWVTMTKAQMVTMAGGTVAGTNDQEFIPVTLQGDIFASTDNDDYKRNGPAKATVKGDCNDQDTLFEFAPPSVRKIMDATGYTWVAGEESGTGYFTTAPISSFDTPAMAGTAGQYGGFCRRQIFSSKDQNNATLEDIFSFNQGHSFGTKVIQIQTKKTINYSGGCLKISGDVFDGAIKWEDDNSDDYIALYIGIGLDYNTAKWYYINQNHLTISHGWSNSQSAVITKIQSGSFKGVGSLLDFIVPIPVVYDGIPCDENSLYGYVFIDILGLRYGLVHDAQHFQIGNMKIEFSREQIYMPTSTTQTRPRTLKQERVSSREYKASNTNGTGEKWNADCIFASDNLMKYGYGLIINPNGTFMETARYGNDLNNPTQEHPEQHLADRVASFWAQSKRQVTTELRTDAVTAITPRHLVTLDGSVFNAAAISREWADDVTKLTLLEKKTQ